MTSGWVGPPCFRAPPKKRLPPMPRHPTDALDTAAETAVVLLLIGRTGAYSCSDLLADTDFSIPRVCRAVSALADAGILRVNGEHLSAAPALERLERLGLVLV